MVRSLIACVVKLINSSPSKNGIPSSMSPSMIVENKGKPKFNHKCITFGSYDMVYNGTKNYMKKGAYQPSHLTNHMITEVIIS